MEPTQEELDFLDRAHEAHLDRLVNTDDETPRRAIKIFNAAGEQIVFKGGQWVVKE